MNARQKKRVTRDEWLKTALQLFAANGEGGLRVEKLARELNVAKSGFYFHFKDRDDVLQQLLDYWAHEYTEIVTQNSLLLMSPPKQRLLMIATYVFENNLTEFDAAMVVWSRKDKMTDKRVKQVIKMRLKFLTQAFKELGFEGDDADIRARIFLGYITAARDNFSTNAKLAAQVHERLVEMVTI